MNAKLQIGLVIALLALFVVFKLCLCDDLENFRGGRGRGGRGRRGRGGRGRHWGGRRGGWGRRSWGWNRPWYGSWWNNWWPSYWWSAPGGQYCQDCGYLSRGACSSCTNCGYAINASGYGSCVPGGPNGPYFQQDAVAYEY